MGGRGPVIDDVDAPVAQAIAHDPRILVLDDALSRLHAEQHAVAIEHGKRRGQGGHSCRHADGDRQHHGGERHEERVDHVLPDAGAESIEQSIGIEADTRRRPRRQRRSSMRRSSSRPCSIVER